MLELPGHSSNEMSTPTFSRFHAIITAKSIDGAGPPVITTLPEDASNPYGPWGVRFDEKKRRRDSNAEAGPSVVKKPVKRGSEDEGIASKEVSKSLARRRTSQNDSLPSAYQVVSRPRRPP